MPLCETPASRLPSGVVPMAYTLLPSGSPVPANFYVFNLVFPLVYFTICTRVYRAAGRYKHCIRSCVFQAWKAASFLRYHPMQNTFISMGSSTK